MAEKDELKEGSEGMTGEKGTPGPVGKNLNEILEENKTLTAENLELKTKLEDLEEKLENQKKYAKTLRNKLEHGESTASKSHEF